MAVALLGDGIDRGLASVGTREIRDDVASVDIDTNGAVPFALKHCAGCLANARGGACDCDRLHLSTHEQFPGDAACLTLLRKKR